MLLTGFFVNQSDKKAERKPILRKIENGTRQKWNRASCPHFGQKRPLLTKTTKNKALRLIETDYFLRVDIIYTYQKGKVALWITDT